MEIPATVRQKAERLQIQESIGMAYPVNACSYLLYRHGEKKQEEENN